MADQHWFDEMSRALATGSSRREALRRLGAVVAGAALGALVPAPAPAEAQTPPLDNANCGEVGNACPTGARCVRGTEAGFGFETGVCVCEKGGNPRGVPCGATSPISGGGRVFRGGTCCRSPLACAREDGRETCGCGQGTTPCPTRGQRLTCCPADSRCCVSHDGRSAQCCPPRRGNVAGVCLLGQCVCSTTPDGFRTKFCNGQCCTYSGMNCVGGRCRCPRDEPIQCGRACFPRCRPVNGVPHFLSRRTCTCQPCRPPREVCDGLNLCLAPCPAGKIRDQQTCECKVGLCPSGSTPCGFEYLVNCYGDPNKPHCCAPGQTCRPGPKSCAFGPPHALCCYRPGEVTSDSCGYLLA